MIQTKFSLLVIFIVSVSHIGLCNDNLTSTTIIDSLKGELELAENAERFHILLQLSKQTLGVNPNQAESYMLDAKVYIDENSINQDLFDYYSHMTSVKLWQNQFEEVIKFSDMALQLQFDGLDLKRHPGVYEQRGAAYSLLGEHVKAQETLFHGLRIADSLELDMIKANIYNSIGLVYVDMNDIVMTEKYFLLALEQSRKVHNQSFIASGLANLAAFYVHQKRYSDAEKLIIESTQLAMKEGDNNTIGTNYHNLGQIFYEQKKYKKALSYFQKALASAKQNQQLFSLVLRHIGVAEAYVELHNYKLAKENIETGLDIAVNQNNNVHYAKALFAASKIYEHAGEHRKALDYHKKYTELNDSLVNESRIKAVVELQEKYDSEKKEKEILVLSNDKVSAIKRERTLVQAILLLCFGLLALGALFYFLRQNHKKNSIIQKKNLKIASDKIQLLEKGKEIIALESLVKGQESERERLAKEMHDGLGGLLAISHSKLTNLRGPEMKANAALSEARDLIRNAYDQVRQISHNLMPLDLEKFGLVAALTNMIQRINQQNEINIDFRTYHFDLFLNNELGLNIYRISQEALANILKSAKARNVLVELIQHDDMISLSIEDDGVGFILNSENSGIGIRNMRNRTELLNGEFSIESKLTEGTSIFALFPHFSDELTPSQI